MNFTLITNRGRVMSFYVLAVAKLYQVINGGTLINGGALILPNSIVSSTGNDLSEALVETPNTQTKGNFQ
jgi:hypothetical protein